MFTIAAGVLKVWPYGPHHMMLFLAPLMCVSVGCGLCCLGRNLGVSPALGVLIQVCVGVPAVRATVGTAANPSESEQLRPVLEYVDRHAQLGDGIFAYYATTPAVRHYWKRDEIEVFLQYGDRGDLPRFAVRFDRFMADHKRVWFVFTHNWKNEREEWIGYLKRHYKLADWVEVADASAHLFEPTCGGDGATDSVGVLRASPRLSSLGEGGASELPAPFKRRLEP